MHRRNWTASVLGIVLLAACVPAGSEQTAESANTRVVVPDTGPTLPSALLNVFPFPQHVSPTGVTVPLTGQVTIVRGARVSDQTVDDTVAAVRAAGGTPTVQPEAAPLPSSDGSVIRLKIINLTDSAPTPQPHPFPANMPTEGYVLSSQTEDDHPTLTVVSPSPAGTYYGVQTLRQLAGDGQLPAVRITDWPGLPIRGVVEGFYGVPWSHSARLDLLHFAGRHKLNTFVYAAKDDDLLRARWREPFTTEQLAKFRELVAAAESHHVRFTVALSPGLDLCYTSAEDYTAARTKLTQLQDAGVKYFTLAFDDIEPQFHCERDSTRFPGDTESALARAQADFTNRLVADLSLTGASVVPTRYHGTDPHPYKDTLGRELATGIAVQWTGPGIISAAIPAADARAAREQYHAAPLVVWDNYPVNDGDRTRLFLGPLPQRAPELDNILTGLTANPMIQPYASQVALAGVADYTWNPTGFSAEVSWRGVLNELAGPNLDARRALHAFADSASGWQPYSHTSVEAPALTQAIAQFEQGDGAPLRTELELLAALPAALADLPDRGFAADIAPWAQALSAQARGTLHLLAAREAAARDDRQEVARQLDAWSVTRAAADSPTVAALGGDGTVRQAALVPVVADGHLLELQNDLLAELDSQFSLEAAPARRPYQVAPSTTLDTNTDLPLAQAVDGQQDTAWQSGGGPHADDSLTVDLGKTAPVGAVELHQASADDEPGDMFHYAVVETSADGENWQELGRAEEAARIFLPLDEPVAARYVRVRAARPNPGDKWVMVREFVVWPPSAEVATTLPKADVDSEAGADGKLATSFLPAPAPNGGTFTRQVPLGSTRQLTIVAAGEGQVEAEVAGQWQPLDEIDQRGCWLELEVPPAADAVRLRFTGSTARVHDMSFSAAD